MHFKFLRNRRLVFVLFCIVVLSSTFFFWYKQREKSNEEAQARVHVEKNASSISEKEANTHGWDINNAEGGSISDYVYLFGKIDLHPERAMHLHPKFSGIVRHVYKAIGDAVKPGEVLARVENSAGLQTYDLVSSISGVVLNRLIATGQAVTEDVEAFTIADPSLVVVKLAANARDLVKLAKGQSVVISANEVPDISSSVTYVSPVLDEDTQSAPILVTVENQELKLRPGQFATARVVTNENAVSIRVPKEAIDRRGPHVGELYVRSGENFWSKPVKIGRSDREFVEIIEGLSVGEQYLYAEYAEVNSVIEKKLARQNAD